MDQKKQRPEAEDSAVLKPDLEKSQEQARLIAVIGMHVVLLDRDYLAMAARETYNQASFYDSAAALNPGYDPSKSELKIRQAQAIQALVTYIDSLKAVDEAKIAVGRSDQHRDEIMALFS